MKGWKLFLHSVQLVLRNWQVALRIFAVPMILVAAVIYFALSSITVEQTSFEDFRALLWALPIAGFLTLWAVVAWHRYVLLEETPNGWVPSMKISEITAYFFKGFLLFLVAFLIMVVVILLGGAIASAGAGAASFVATFAGMFFVSVMIYRWIAVLPAAAIGKSLRMSEAYEATDGATGAIVVVMLCVFGISLLVQLATTGLAVLSNELAVVLDIIASAILALINISILTTFYGHYIEGRSIV